MRGTAKIAINMRAPLEETINATLETSGRYQFAACAASLGPATQCTPHPTADFDGIICIGGEDWWYHNRGHFDFQIMRRLRAAMAGAVRQLARRAHAERPRTTSSSLARIERKLKSLGARLVNVENQFWVFSPVDGAGRDRPEAVGLGARRRRSGSPPRRAGIRNPVLWMHCPAGADRSISDSSVRGSRHAAHRPLRGLPRGDPAWSACRSPGSKASADLVVYCAPHLMAEERGEVRAQLLVTHGVDLDMFVAAGRCVAARPGRCRALSRAPCRLHRRHRRPHLRPRAVPRRRPQLPACISSS